MAKAAKNEPPEEFLHQRLQALEQVHLATLNILEDFDDEKSKLKQFQQATMNILEDFDDEKSKLKQFQQATMNILDDMYEERSRLDDTERALLNILEDVEMERNLAEQSKSLLETVNQELEAFSYSVSHDLRAPLRAVSGFAEAVQEDYGPLLDDEGKRYLGLIEQNARKMGRLIDDLLAFSRIGRREMVQRQIDVQALANEVFAELSATVSGRDIEFKAMRVPPAYGDTSMVRQVLVNLLANAVKFTGPTKKAVIELGFSEKKRAYYVKDNGVGFDMHYADKLFGVFQRLHAETEFEGTGVGLALVHRIVTRHGGRVWAESEVGEGATFFFTLSAEEQIGLKASGVQGEQ